MQEAILKTLQAAILQQVFPGAVVAYVAKGEQHIIPAGRLTYESQAPVVTAKTVYDVASITKSIPTSSLVLQLIEQGQLSLDTPVKQFIPELQNPFADTILVRHLLTYTVVFDIPGGLSTIGRRGAEAALQAIFTANLQAPPGKTYFYTNPPAILLGLLAERLRGKPLDRLASETFFEPLGMTMTTFHPSELRDAQIAPTEIDDRGQLQGMVHDETAWAMRAAGMIPGNAGLFSTAEDLLTFARMLLAEGTYQGEHYFKPATIESMHTNQIRLLGQSTGLGWELGQPQFMGSRASTHCFGKTGFTGTLILVDPERQAAFVLLSNRTYPKRPADRGGITSVRRAIADIVFA